MRETVSRITTPVLDLRDILQQCSHLHHSGTGSIDLARDAVSGGLRDEGPSEVYVPDMLESEAGVDTVVKVGWAGFGGAGLDTSEGDTKRADGSVSSSPSGSSRSISI